MNRRVALLAGGLVVLIILFTTAWNRDLDIASISDGLRYGYTSGNREKVQSPFSATAPGSTEPWTFDADRDRNDHSLTHEQCDAAFPDLYHEIDRARAYWEKRQGKKLLTDAQWGIEWSQESGLRAMIYNNQLHIIESRGLNHFLHWEERSKATLNNIHRALQAAREPVPDIEFSIKIDDNIHLAEEGGPDTTVWCFSRNVSDPRMEQVWLIPDFNFWAYPRVAGSYGDFQRDAIAIGADFDAKIPQLVWRGTQEFNPGIRQALLDVTAEEAWADVHRVAEDSDDADSAAHRIPLRDHCRYQFAAHTEGTTWSGRLKYLLSCNSVVFAHPLTFTTHLYHLLRASGREQNYVATRADWMDLPDKVTQLLEDEDLARRIAGNAKRLFRDRYMTPAAQTCYFRRLFRVWAEVTPVPQPYIMANGPNGKERKWRGGMTYEEYLFHKSDVPVKE